jgi:hypothetical protein
MSEIPVIPVKQTTIEIAGKSFVAVLLLTGETGLLFPQLCEFLGLQASDQAYRIRNHPTIPSALVLIQIETPGGPQAINVLLVWGIPPWLARIRPDKRPPVYRQRLEALQRDAFVTLSKPFFQNVTEEPPQPKHEKPSAGVRKPPSVLEAIQGLEQGVQALHEGVHTLYRAVAAEKQEREEEMSILVQEMQAMEARLQRLEGRPTPAQPAASQPSDALVPFMPLTVRQYRILFEMLKQLQRQTGLPLQVLAS